jgi:hypothetical protein
VTIDVPAYLHCMYVCCLPHHLLNLLCIPHHTGHLPAGCQTGCGNITSCDTHPSPEVDLCAPTSRPSDGQFSYIMRAHFLAAATQTITGNPTEILIPAPSHTSGVTPATHQLNTSTSISVRWQQTGHSALAPKTRSAHALHAHRCSAGPCLKPVVLCCSWQMQHSLVSTLECALVAVTCMLADALATAAAQSPNKVSLTVSPHVVSC